MGTGRKEKSEGEWERKWGRGWAKSQEPNFMSLSSFHINRKLGWNQR